MSAVIVPFARSPLELLLESDQLTEWAAFLDAHRRDGRRLAIAYTTDRRSAANRLARRYSATPSPVATLGQVAGRMQRGDLLIVLASPVSRIHTAPCAEGTPVGTLHRLLTGGSLVWGITGPRPNPVADHCHDTVAVPADDPGMLLEGHQRVIDALVAYRARRRAS